MYQPDIFRYGVYARYQGPYPFRPMDSATQAEKDMATDQAMLMDAIREGASLNRLFHAAHIAGFTTREDPLFGAAGTAIKRYADKGNEYIGVLATGQKYIDREQNLCDATLFAFLKPDTINPGWWNIEMLVGAPVTEYEPAIPADSPLITCAVGIDVDGTLKLETDMQDPRFVEIALQVLSLTPRYPSQLATDFSAAVLYLTGNNRFFLTSNAFSYLFADSPTQVLPVLPALSKDSSEAQIPSTGKFKTLMTTRRHEK